MKRYLGFLFLVIALVVACGGDSGSSTTSASPTTAPTTPPTTPAGTPTPADTPGADGSGTLEIRVTDQPADAISSILVTIVAIYAPAIPVSPVVSIEGLERAVELFPAHRPPAGPNWDRFRGLRCSRYRRGCYGPIASWRGNNPSKQLQWVARDQRSYRYR